MNYTKHLCYLTALSLLAFPVSSSTSYAQDASIFQMMDGEVPEAPNEPEDAVPEPSAEEGNPFEAYQQSIEREGEVDLFGLADNEGQGQPTPEDLEAEIREESFNAAVNGFLPLRPDEIRRFLEIYDEVKQASNTPIYPYPRQVSKVQEISLDPADAPSVIKLATGHVSHIAFYDSTGAKWPIASISWAGDFDINTPEEGGASLRIIPLSDFSYGNIVIQMSKLQTPIVFTLQAQRDEVHVRYEAMLPEPGPYAKPSLIGRSGPKTTSGSVTTVSVLDGTPPSSARMMKVSGADSRTKAYELNGSVYLRTPHTLISPAWSESASSGDGMNVYVINKTPVVLLSEKGKIVRALLKDKENNL